MFGTSIIKNNTKGNKKIEKTTPFSVKDLLWKSNFFYQWRVGCKWVKRKKKDNYNMVKKEKLYIVFHMNYFTV